MIETVEQSMLLPDDISPTAVVEAARPSLEIDLPYRYINTKRLI
jgi:hypothetical protein